MSLNESIAKKRKVQKDDVEDNNQDSRILPLIVKRNFAIRSSGPPKGPCSLPILQIKPNRLTSTQKDILYKQSVETVNSNLSMWLTVRSRDVPSFFRDGCVSGDPRIGTFGEVLIQLHHKELQVAEKHPNSIFHVASVSFKTPTLQHEIELISDPQMIGKEIKNDCCLSKSTIYDFPYALCSMLRFREAYITSRVFKELVEELRINHFPFVFGTLSYQRSTSTIYMRQYTSMNLSTFIKTYSYALSDIPLVFFLLQLTTAFTYLQVKMGGFVHNNFGFDNVMIQDTEVRLFHEMGELLTKPIFNNEDARIRFPIDVSSEFTIDDRLVPLTRINLIISDFGNACIPDMYEAAKFSFDDTQMMYAKRVLAPRACKRQKDVEGDIRTDLKSLKQLTHINSILEPSTEPGYGSLIIATNDEERDQLISSIKQLGSIPLSSHLDIVTGMLHRGFRQYSFPKSVKFQKCLTTIESQLFNDVAVRISPSQCDEEKGDLIPVPVICADRTFAAGLDYLKAIHVVELSSASSFRYALWPFSSYHFLRHFMSMFNQTKPS